MNRKRLFLNLGIAYEAVLGNIFRSVLTALGIIFGVAAVIAMMAIGKGAKKEILDQLKMVGVNNIEITKVISSGEEQTTENEENDQNSKKFTPGLTLSDAQSIAKVIPSAQNICPELNTQIKAFHGTAHNSVNLIGTVPSFFKAFHFQISKGQNFSGKQLELGLPVCIIGKNVEAKLFRGSPSLGKYIKCGPHWLQVIGIIEKIGINSAAAESAQIRNYNNDVYIPIKTFLARFQKDGAELSSSQTVNEDDEENNKDYHELDRIIVQMGSAELLKPASELLEKMLLRRHNGVADFQIVVPELLLKQEQRSKDIFNWVLLAIAFISLLVGGIGIMNIMLASVYERIKEIGIRMSMGATESDIVMQFLLEAIIISLTGGIIGVFLGIALSFSISIITDITTIISWASVIISFFVSAGVGLIFGIIPARKAAKQDPITSLRHE